MQSSYLDLLWSVYLQALSKHEQTPKLGFFGLHEHFVQQSIIRHCILTKVLCHMSASAPAFVGSSSTHPCSAGSSTSSAQLFHTHWSALHYLKCISVHTCAGCVQLHPLPGYPNMEQLETGLSSSSLIIPATNNRIVGKSGFRMGSHSEHSVTPRANWKWWRYCLDTFPALRKDSAAASPSFACLADGRARALPHCCRGQPRRQCPGKVSQDEKAGWKLRVGPSFGQTHHTLQ